MLTNHASRCTALVNLREELYMLEEKSISPSGTVYDTQPRGGDGAVRGADIMLNNYVSKEDYRKRIAAIKRKVDAVDRALKNAHARRKYLLNVVHIACAEQVRESIRTAIQIRLGDLPEKACRVQEILHSAVWGGNRRIMATKRRSCEYCVHATEDETKRTYSIVCLLDWTKKVSRLSVCKHCEPYATSSNNKKCEA